MVEALNVLSATMKRIYLLHSGAETAMSLKWCVYACVRACVRVYVAACLGGLSLNPRWTAFLTIASIIASRESAQFF